MNNENNKKLSNDDFNYAIENTKIIHEPDRRIDTFGATTFNYLLLSELMDTSNDIRIREGKVEAHKPTIIKPDIYNNTLFQGFGEYADQFSDWLKENNQSLAILKYGFTFKLEESKAKIIKGNLKEKGEDFKREAIKSGDPIMAIITGIEDTWEISLLKFTIDMIQKSTDINMFDLRRRGLF